MEGGDGGVVIVDGLVTVVIDDGGADGMFDFLDAPRRPLPLAKITLPECSDRLHICILDLSIRKQN